MEFRKNIQVELKHGVKRRSVTIVDDRSPGDGSGVRTQERAQEPPDLISTRMGPTLVSSLEQNYKDKRHEIVLETGLIVTPLSVVKDLSYAMGSPLEIKTFEIHGRMETFGPGKMLHRVSVTVGEFTGDGQTPRYRLALQLAAADLLEKMKQADSENELPEYGLLPGSRVSPFVYRELRELCDMEGLAYKPTYARVTSYEVGSTLNFAFKCIVGQAETIGSSDSIFLAKRLATKKMYEALTGETYPDEVVATGEGCLSEEDFKAMDINPVASVRTTKRMERTTGSMDSSVLATSSRESKGEDLYDDEFGEDLDTIVLMRAQLEGIKLGP